MLTLTSLTLIVHRHALGRRKTEFVGADRGVLLAFQRIAAALTILLDGITPERLPSASGVSNFARITAGSFAASLVTTTWDRREALHQTRLTEAGNAFSPLYRDAIARGDFDAIAAAAADCARIRDDARSAR